MNIALFTEMEKVDGQGRFMLLQARWLAEHGHKVVVFSPISPLLEAIAESDIVHVSIGSVRQAAPLQYEELVADAARLVRACEEYAIDVMIATAKLPFIMARAALRDRLPVFIVVLSDTYFLPATKENVTEMQSAAREGRIIAYSFDTMVGHANTFQFDRNDVRYGTFPIDDRVRTPERPRNEVRASIGIEPDELMLLTICRLDIDKAPTIAPLARAADSVSTRLGKRVRFVVVGDGTLAQETRMEAPPSAIFLGTRRDLADLYHACDIYAGESTTVLEAATAQRPVIMTCAGFHPEKPDVAFGIYGLHSLDYAFTQWSNHGPPVSFEEALFYLAQDEELRRRLGRVALDTAMSRNHVDHVMPWIVDVLARKPTDNALFGERARAQIFVPGGMADGIDTLGKLCHERGSDLRLAVAFEEPVPWARALAMPLDHMRALSLAARRIVDDETPRSRYVGDELQNPERLPHDIVEGFNSVSKTVPPTSFEPPFAINPSPQRLHAVFAGSSDAAIELIRAADAAPHDAIVVWLPQGQEEPGSASLMQRLSAETVAGVVLIPEPLAWTIMGRLIGAVQTYRDDGSDFFSNHRKLAAQLNVETASSVGVR